MLKLEVRSTNVLIAPAVTLVSAASSKPGLPFSLKSKKQVTKPPKIKISEASNHQTANRPVGIPVALRCVAIIGGLVLILMSWFWLMKRQRYNVIGLGIVMLILYTIYIIKKKYIKSIIFKNNTCNAL